MSAIVNNIPVGTASLSEKSLTLKDLQNVQTVDSTLVFTLIHPIGYVQVYVAPFLHMIFNECIFEYLN